MQARNMAQSTKAKQNAKRSKLAKAKSTKAKQNAKRSKLAKAKSTKAKQNAKRSKLAKAKRASGKSNWADKNIARAISRTTAAAQKLTLKRKAMGHTVDAASQCNVGMLPPLSMASA
jgi:hypothetical protein